MTELETQVVKIQLGDSKQATSYVYTLAEKIDSSDSELFMVCELPVFNPAAIDECERIAGAMAASLKRSYRKSVTKQTFENTLAIINEELGKLVSLGKTHWLGKLNAVIAVKHGTSLSVASAGKISAMLFREGNFSPIAEASTPTHPLKTFENFSVGKLRLNDLLVLSTTQLFNHISADRIKNIFKRNELPDAAQEIITTLKDQIGPEVACGTILAMQLEPGSTNEEEEIDLQTYIDGPSVTSEVKDENWLDKLKSVKTTAVTITKNVGGDLKDKFKKQKIGNLVKTPGPALDMVQSQFKKVSKQFQPSTIKGYSRQKKFFMISAAILLIALVTNIAIARYSKDSTAPTTVASIESLEKLANDTNAALLYGDEAQALIMLGNLKSELAKLSNVPENQREAVDKIRSQANELQNKIDKVTNATVRSLGTLGVSDHLIALPEYLATEANRQIISYNRNGGGIQDNVLKSSEPILQSAFFKSNQAVIHNGDELLLWNFQTGVIGGAFSDTVPNRNDLAGLKIYPTNSKVYMIDKAKTQVVSFAVNDRSFSNPTVSIKPTPELANASDLAIDGNIYIASGGTIHKFNSGEKQDFSIGVSAISSTAKLYTQIDYNYIYVLDIGNKRIVILNKDGSKFTTLVSDQFNDLKDFAVDETNKTIYVLNSSNLLEVKF